MKCEQDKYEKRQFKEIDLYTSSTSDLHKYYNDFVLKNLHEYQFDVKIQKKRPQTAGKFTLVVQEYKDTVMARQRFMGNAYQSSKNPLVQQQAPLGSQQSSVDGGRSSTKSQSDVNKLNNRAEKNKKYLTKAASNF